MKCKRYSRTFRYSAIKIGFVCLRRHPARVRSFLRFIYEHGSSSIDDFFDKSGYDAEGRSHISAVEGFREAARKGFIGIDQIETASTESTMRYKALVDARALRSLLVRNAVNATFEAETEEFRQLMTEFVKLPRE